MTSVEEEKLHNPRLGKSKEEFLEIMANLNLSYPEQIGEGNNCCLHDGVYTMYVLRATIFLSTVIVMMSIWSTKMAATETL